MTNLEFYKNEIKEQYEEYKKYSNSDTFTQDLADVLFAIWKKHRTTRGDLLDWLCEDYQTLGEEELKETVLDYTDDLKYQIKDIELSLAEILNEIADLEERIKE